MLTPSTPVATPFPIDSTNTVKAATVEAHARAAVQAQLRAGNANEARAADIAAAQTTSRRAATAIPDPMASLSTVAVAGAMNTLPAALGMLQRIALASASGTLTDADRQNLQAEHAQLTAKVVGSVGSVGAGEQAQTSTAHDQAQEDAGGHARHQDAGGRGNTAPTPMPTAGPSPRNAPRAELPAHAAQVAAASHEAAAAAPPPPPEPAPADSPGAHALAAHAAQVTQFVQAAQPGHVAPLVAVA